jgi:hypothetical protein
LLMVVVSLIDHSTDSVRTDSPRLFAPAHPTQQLEH